MTMTMAMMMTSGKQECPPNGCKLSSPGYPGLPPQVGVIFAHIVIITVFLINIITVISITLILIFPARTVPILGLDLQQRLEDEADDQAPLLTYWQQVSSHPGPDHQCHGKDKDKDTHRDKYAKTKTMTIKHLSYREQVGFLHLSLPTGSK